MWRLKSFMPKEQTGLEGRSIDVGNLKIFVQNAFAEGGFSCVYLARDITHPTKQYALKHIICNDGEILELVRKEISVIKLLKGHPNVVNMYAHSILDMGRTKEAFLVMEFCEKSLVNILESRGTGYFDEKHILPIFRDICNAVFAMHCQSPPIAHRDLKVENVLLGSDGLWKLCDFGSTSTNHKRFEKPEEMGIEEDIIRKHTTPAYRAPEMWDLFRRELINEKVDIWALGCLFFRICYFKLAFDGESKLQVLNGNYRIPELPKYSSLITDLIRDMFQSSPDDRPDITQIWFRVNEQLPVSLQRSLPDRPPGMPSTNILEGISKHANKPSPSPQRSPPSSKESTHNSPMGAFWTTHHADIVVTDVKSELKFEEEPNCEFPENNPNVRPSKQENVQMHSIRRNVHGKPSNGLEDAILHRGTERPKLSKPEITTVFQNESFNTFVADFDSSKLSSGLNNKTSNEEALEVEIVRLKEQLQQANAEKTDITSKYEKLSAICRSQRQELQVLKQALAAIIPPPNKDASKDNLSGICISNNNQGDKTEVIGDINLQNCDSKSWQAFAEDTELRTSKNRPTISSVRTKSSPQNMQGFEGFGVDSFTAVPTVSQVSGSGLRRFSNSGKVETKRLTSHPAGWSGF